MPHSDSFKLKLNRLRRDAEGFPIIKINDGSEKRILTEDDSVGGGAPAAGDPLLSPDGTFQLVVRNDGTFGVEPV